MTPTAKPAIEMNVSSSPFRDGDESGVAGAEHGGSGKPQRPALPPKDAALKLPPNWLPVGIEPDKLL